MKSLLVKFSLLYLFINCVHTDIGEYKSYKDYKIFNIQYGDGLQDFIGTMKKFNEHVHFAGNLNKTQMLIAPDLVPTFQEIAAAAKLQTKLVVDDYSELIEIEKLALQRQSGFSWDAYYDIDYIYGYLKNMSLEYPKWTKLVVGGKSYEGRQILGLRINTPTQKLKPVIFIESGIHAREWIVPATTTYFINQLLTSSNPDIAALRDQFDWHIFPSANPDGYQYTFTNDRMWRKTRSKSPNGCYGADPNRNWDYNWGQYGTSDDPCQIEIYGGSGPFSEVETRTLSQYIAGLKNLTVYIDFHANAQMMLVPFSDSLKHIDNYDDLIKIGTTSLDYGDKVGVGDRYLGPDTAAALLYRASGISMDWVRYTFGTPLVFAYELRGYNFNWPSSKIYQQGDEVTQMLLGLLTEARNLGYFKNFSS